MQGSPAHSAFRAQRLIGQINRALAAASSSQALADIQVVSLGSRHLHAVDCTQTLNHAEMAILQNLLTYGPTDDSNTVGDHQFIVSPREGTISPWSSKATDIIHNTGLSKVIRVERAIEYQVTFNQSVNDLWCDSLFSLVAAAVHDRMTEQVMQNITPLEQLFTQAVAQPMTTIDAIHQGIAALEKANSDLGLALADDEISYLHSNYSELSRNPTDVELMMFAQANSEHCRHKIFNADWIIDGQVMEYSLFEMIKNSYRANSGKGVLSAYSDNAAVMTGNTAKRFFPLPSVPNQAASLLDKSAGNATTGPSAKLLANQYHYVEEPVHYLLKVETHNHPTAIAPFPGAATGAGGEIRDEGATGSGAKPKAGLTGFSVSNLEIPGFAQPWEFDYGKPERMVSALDIMLEGPIGGAAFNNEFGRPNIGGYFRSFTLQLNGENSDAQRSQVRGYHKPIMIAGGIGNIREPHVHKQPLQSGDKLVVLGGPAMLIGLGGGAASSMSAGQSAEDLDFASVQRDNPEIERRCQEVIDRCWQMGEDNPIAFIHDVGAGGLSNALPELVKDGGVGGLFSLRDIPSDEAQMAPHEIWCNESQERYVLALRPTKLALFDALCQRERAPYAVVGDALTEQQLTVVDSHFDNKPVDLPMSVLFGKTPKMQREVTRLSSELTPFVTQDIDFSEAAKRVLSLPTVASKSFLITIGDRTVSGLVYRDQMIGPWQVPVADAAVTLNSYSGYGGEAMAMGERTPIALIDAAASARMAVSEAITNIASAPIDDISSIVLSANWMAACGFPGEDSKLYEAVEAVGMALCPQLGIAIPVGKDSLSMNTRWRDSDGIEKEVTAPLSLIVTAAARVDDVRLGVDPQLANAEHNTTLLLVDISAGKQRLGASALAQVYSQLGDESPDLDDANDLKAFFVATQRLMREHKILAYHDRSDGGVFATVCEMMFAGRAGVELELNAGQDPIAWSFNEEAGAVIQVNELDVDHVLATYHKAGLASVSVIGRVVENPMLCLRQGQDTIYRESLINLHAQWHETSYRLQKMRDNPESAEQERDAIHRALDGGLFADLRFDAEQDIVAPYINNGIKPSIAILREQGVNSQYEMAAAFDRAGFTAIDIHMSDLLAGRDVLTNYQGLAVCGGFSYGDVLGAGEGWAKTILYNEQLMQQFSDFFHLPNTFTLGVCNGCQMLSSMRELIPGAAHWPRFVRNESEQFEARLVMVEVQPSGSPLFADMKGSKMPIVVSHGEGRAELDTDQATVLAEQNTVLLRYIDHNGNPTQRYPHNPNGSPAGLAGVCSTDGRVNIMMPHPERVFRTVQFSWAPNGWGEDSPWMRLFRNARVFVD